MSDKDRDTAPKVEAQPLRPLPMPEYHYQIDYVFSGSLDQPSGCENQDDPDSMDLSGVCLNFS